MGRSISCTKYMMLLQVYFEVRTYSILINWNKHVKLLYSTFTASNMRPHHGVQYTCAQIYDRSMIMTRHDYKLMGLWLAITIDKIDCT